MKGRERQNVQTNFFGPSQKDGRNLKGLGVQI
jgi:hypothetical protein